MAETKTMTAEEVAECKSIVREALGCDLESLRDLAAQAARVPGLVARVDAAMKSVALHEDQIAVLLEQVGAAESERDAARKEVERLTGQLAYVTRAMDDGMNALREDNATLSNLAKRGGAALDERDTLRERVATLFAESEKWKEAARAVNELHDTAEARVRELEAKVEEVRRVLAYVRECEGGPALLDEAKALEWVRRDEVREELAETKAALETARRHSRVGMGARTTLLDPASRPPPAPAHGTSDLWIEAEGAAREAYERALERREPTGNALSEGIRAGLRVLAPTPPPGLREAVERHLYLVREVTQAIRPEAPLCASSLKAACDDLQAAYDATGGEHPDTAALRDLRADVARVLEMARLGVHVGDTATEVGEKAVQAVRALHEDAAKYRAAVEMAKDTVALGKAAYEGQSGTPEAEWMVPWEQFDEFDREMHTHQGVAVAQRLLGLTLDTPPSGPGGGEKKTRNPNPVAVQGITFDPPVTETQANAAMDALHRARIAPTPTPEVPPLKPSTPAVVWEGDGVRVVKHPDAVDFTVSYSHAMGPIGALGVLARALAEAKREVERLNAERQETACEAIRRFASRLGDDATGFDKVSHLEELEVSLYQHVMDEEDKARAHAAESMRERAKQAILKQQATEEDGPCSDDNGYAFNMLLRLADEVGKIPLE